MGTPEVKDENMFSVSSACRKKRQNVAVSRNNVKNGGPVSVLERARLKTI